MITGKFTDQVCFIDDTILNLYTERLRQYQKFGEQSHTVSDWLSILAEEVGECFKANNDNDIANLKNELIQVATVAVNIAGAISKAAKIAINEGSIDE